MFSTVSRLRLAKSLGIGNAASRFGLRALALALTLLLLPLPQVLAANIEVNSDCSLANAIKAANEDNNAHNDLCTAGSGADIITLTGHVALTVNLPEINSTITIEGAGPSRSRVDGRGKHSIISVVADTNGVGHVTLNNLTVTGGKLWGQTGGGGASVRIRVSAAASASPSLTITNSKIHGNHAAYSEGGGNGGGVSATGANSRLTIRNSVIYDNEATSGAGIYIKGATATIENSAIYSNIGDISGTGGIHIVGGNATIMNSTIHSNKVGGVYVNNGSATLTHVTIANQVTQGTLASYGINKQGTGKLKLRNSLISGNPRGDCEISGALSENVGNLIGDNSCASTSPAKHLSGNPKLGALAGSGAYYLLQSDSPAIGVANADHCLANDQRGLARGSTCDIGAIEYLPPPMANFTATVDKNLSKSLTYHFDASPSTGSLITSYQWEFGDNATGSRLKASHTYPRAGEYKVTLTVANSDGGSHSISKDLNVQTPPIPAEASFDFTVSGYRVDFTSTASGSNLTHSWDVDEDGVDPYSGAIISHTYSSAGARLVTLTVSNAVTTPGDSATHMVKVPSRVTVTGYSPPAEPTPIRTPSPNTCLTLPASIRISPATGGVQCLRVSGAAISDAAIRQAMTDAVDVWSWVRPNTQVCFAAVGGTIKFIDTTPIPRVVYDLPAYRSGGMTCATIDRPGTVALLPGPPAPARYRSLPGCMVTTQDLIRFRDAPGGAPLQYTDPWGRQEDGLLPPSVTLTALERTADWFKVDYYGTQGWISARHVSPQGACG